MPPSQTPHPTFPIYPRVTAKNFTAWNERMFKKYNNERVYFHPNPFIRFVERTRVRALLDLLSPRPKTDVILSAGCGEGYIEQQLSCRHLYMVDLSREAIARAKKNTYPAARITFRVANLQHLPFRSRHFHKVECSEVIEHVYSPRKLLQELARVTRDSGTLVISFPNEPLINFIKKIFISLGLFHLIFPNVPRDMTQEWHLHAFTLARFRSLSADIWHVSQIVPVPWSFLPIRYVIRCRKL